MPSLERRGCRCQNASRQRGAKTHRRQRGGSGSPSWHGVHGGRAARQRHGVAEAGRVADGGAGEERDPQPCECHLPQGTRPHRMEQPSAWLQMPPCHPSLWLNASGAGAPCLAMPWAMCCDGYLVLAGMVLAGMCQRLPSTGTW